MIDGIIAAQLRSAKRVVVPDLGSFIHKEGGQTVFMEFLKKDDGVLTAALAREFGLDAAEAQSVAAEWAAGVRRTVQSGGRYVLADVGALHADANGLIVLEEQAGGAPFVATQEPAPVVVPEPAVAPAPVFTPEPVPAVAQAPVFTPGPIPAPIPVFAPAPLPPAPAPKPAPAPVDDWAAQPAPSFEPKWESTIYKESAPAHRDSAAEQSKAFTLNDLYADPEPAAEEFSQQPFNDAGYVQPAFNDGGFGQPAFNDVGFGQPALNDGGFGQPAFNDAVYGGATTLNDVYSTPEPSNNNRQEHHAAKPEHHASHSEHHAPRSERLEGESALRPPQVRRPSQIHSTHRRKPDIVLVIAIVAAVVAIAMMIYGLSNNNASVVRKSTGNGVDTTTVQTDSAAVEVPVTE